MEKPHPPNDAASVKFTELAAFVLLAVTIVGLPLLFFKTTKSNFIMPKQWVYEPLIMLSALLWGLSMFFGKRVEILRTRLYLFAAIFLAACIISVFVSKVPYEGSKALMGMLAAATGGFLVANLARTRLRVLCILCGMSLVGCIEAFWGIMQRLGHKVLFKVSIEAVGTLGNSNYLGAFLGLLLPSVLALGLAEYHRSEDTSRKYLMLGASLLAVLLLVVAIVLTECQGAYIGTGLALLVMIVAWAVRSPGKRKIVVGIMGGVGVIIIIAVIVASALGRMPVKRFAHLGDRAVGGRILMWEASLKMVADHPILGVGIGNYQYNYLKYLSATLKDKDVVRIRHIIQNAEKPHNAYVQFWSETGSFGLAGFLVLLTVFFIGRAIISIKIESPADFWVHAGIVSGFLGFCAVLFVSSVMGIGPLREYFWIFIGLAVAWERVIGLPEKENVTFEIPFGLNMQSSPILLLAVILPAIWYFSSMERSLRYYEASKLWKQGMTYSNRGHVDLAVDMYDKALELIPKDMKLLFYKGSAMVKLSGTVANDKKKAFRQEGINNLVEARKGYSDINLEANLGKAYSDSGRLEEALVHYRTAAATGLKYAYLHSNLGIALMIAGKTDEAEVELAKAFSVDKKSTKTRFFLGLSLLKQNRAAEAEVHFRELTKKNNSNPEVFYNLGLALLRQNRVSEAVASFSKAIAVKPGNIRYMNKLAEALWKSGNKEDAVAQWRKVLEIVPHNSEAKQNLEKFAPQLSNDHTP